MENVTPENITVEWVMKPELVDRGAWWFNQWFALGALRRAADSMVDTSANVAGFDLEVRDNAFDDTRLHCGVPDPEDENVDRVVVALRVNHSLDEAFHDHSLIQEHLENLAVNEAGTEDLKPILEKLRKNSEKPLDD